jgi:hypothetical protein
MSTAPVFGAIYFDWFCLLHLLQTNHVQGIVASLMKVTSTCHKIPTVHIDTVVYQGEAKFSCSMLG